MQSIKDIWESLADRVRNPLLTGFFFSWCVLNYKLLIVLFADEHYQKKFDFIERVLYSNPEISCKQLLIYPAFFSIVYVFVLPGLALLSTWAGSSYERLHSDVRTYALKKLTITAEQRDEIKREAALIVEKAQKEAQDAISARIDTSRTTRENIIKIFNALMPMPTLFNSLLIDPKWNGEVIKPAHGRTVAGTPEQNEFLRRHGILDTWAKLFEVMRIDDISRINAIEAAKRLGISEEEALIILVGLCSLAMLDLDWIDNAPYFTIRESSWVALLNGRPA